MFTGDETGVTKADEAVSLGAGLSIAARHDLPISFVTTGPNVPADISGANAGRLAQRAVALLEEARLEPNFDMEMAR